MKAVSRSSDLRLFCFSDILPYAKQALQKKLIESPIITINQLSRRLKWLT